MTFMPSVLSILIMALLAKTLPHRLEPDTKPVVTAEITLRKILEGQGYTAVPLWKTNYGCFVARVNLCDAEFNFAIDTGAASQLCIDPNSFKRIKVKPELIEVGHVKGIGSELVKCSTGVIDGLSFTDSKYNVGGQNLLAVIPGISIAAELVDPKTGKSETKTIDGLVGQYFLNAESAILDHDSATLFLIPLNKKDGPKLLGRWQCLGGEKNGKALPNAADKWIEIRDDGSVEFSLEKMKMAGVAQLRIHEGNRLISVDKENTEEKDRPIHLGGGRYSVEGNSLKLIFIEKDKKAFLTYFMGQTALKFEAKADSGHIYYEFARKPPEKPKK